MLVEVDGVEEVALLVDVGVAEADVVVCESDLGDVDVVELKLAVVEVWTVDASEVDVATDGRLLVVLEEVVENEDVWAPEVRLVVVKALRDVNEVTNDSKGLLNNVVVKLRELEVDTETEDTSAVLTVSVIDEEPGCMAGSELSTVVEVSTDVEADFVLFDM